MIKIKKGLINIITTTLLAGISCSNNFLEHQVKTTNLAGQVEIENRIISVKDKEGKSIPNIEINYLTDGTNEMVLALDYQGEYYPEKEEFNSTKRRLISEKQKPLIAEILLLLDFVKEYQTFQHDFSKGPGKLLAQKENSNTYCVTKSELEHSVIDVPLGIITVGNEDIKVGLSTPLKEIFSNHIIKQYGTQEGYEVSIPKTAINLCGSDYDAKVCTIDNESLSRQLWQSDGVPHWEIMGSCNPGMSVIPRDVNQENMEGNCEGSQIYKNEKCVQKRCNYDSDCAPTENCIDACVTPEKELVTKQSWICTQDRECLYRGGEYRCMDVCVKLF